MEKVFKTKRTRNWWIIIVGLVVLIIFLNVYLEKSWAFSALGGIIIPVLMFYSRSKTTYIVKDNGVLEIKPGWGQLWHHVRQGGLQPFQGHRCLGERGRRVPQKLSGRVSQGGRLHGKDHSRRQGLRLCFHPVRPPPRPAGAEQLQPEHPGQRRADGPQHPHPGHRCRCHQAGHGAGLAASAGRENGEPPDPDCPR